MEKELKLKIKNKELVVRKRVGSFIEKICNYLEYDFDHEVYKKVIYNEISCNTIFFEKVKRYFDGTMYLLNNTENTFTEDILNTFLYIIGIRKSDSFLRLKIVSKYFELRTLPTLEKSIEFHLFVYRELIGYDEETRLFISLIFFNFVLVKDKVPCIHFVKTDLAKYVNLRDRYLDSGDKEIYEFILICLCKAKFQEKFYYKNLEQITLSDLKRRFLIDKESIKTSYKFKHLYIFGSFSKGAERIDSDIDCVIMFNEDLSYDEKTNLSENFKNDYYKVFNRFVDTHEIYEYLDDHCLKEFSKSEKIF